MIDLLIIGGGPVGCVVAEHAARLNNWKCLVIEKRNHIAGNCFDTKNKSGQLIHKYGPHYFRTNNHNLIQYLSKFTDWIDGNYIVNSKVENVLYPFPINLDTLESFFNKKLTKTDAIRLLREKRVNIAHPKNSEEYVLSRVGKELYEAFYYGYTLKQWHKHPRVLAPSVCGRIPIRFNRDCDYVDAKFKLMPKLGYTNMFKNLTSNPLIQFSYNTDYKKVRNLIIPKVATLYTGPIDDYFHYSDGRLPWRSLEFKWKTFRKEFRQPCVQINYPNNNKFTRTVEIKHVTKQKCPTTSISYEYPKDEGPPYYPIPSDSASLIYKKYQKLAYQETVNKKVYFAGRLAEYTYINTDQAIERGLEVFSQIDSTLNKS